MKFIKQNLRKFTFVMTVLIIMSVITPAAQSAYAASRLNATTITENEFNFNDSSYETYKEKMLDKYMRFDKNSNIPYFDVESAERDNVSKRLIEEAKIFNSEMKAIENEPSVYAGRNYFRRIRNGKYEIGLSSTTCKVIVNGLKFGGKWIIKKLVGLIPGIGFIVDDLVGWLLNKGVKLLRAYTSTGIVITVQKNIYSSGWSFSHRRQ